MKGTIKTINEKGFGFISREGEKKDLFFHSSQLRGIGFADIRVGDVVEFGVGDGEKGPFATDVVLV